MQFTSKTAIGLGALLFSILFVAQLVEFRLFDRAQSQAAEDRGLATSLAIKSEIENLLNRVQTASQALGDQFGERTYSEAEIKSLIKKASLNMKEIRGVTACYEPFAFEAGRRLFCPYYNKTTGKYLMVEDSYDYTKRGDTTAWYTDVIDSGATWTNPYFGAAAGEWFIDFGVPFYYADGPKKGEVRGIIDFSLGVGDLKNIVHALSVGKVGASFIASDTGKFISHPDNDFVGTRTLTDAIKSATAKPSRVGFESMKAKESRHHSFIDSVHEERAWFFSDQIAQSGWSVGFIFYRGDLLTEQRSVHRRYINICLTFSLLVVLGLAAYFGRDQLDPWEIEVLSILATVLLFANVFMVGALQHALKTKGAENVSPPILDKTDLSAEINLVRQRSETRKTDPPIPVPTGIYIERMDFKDSYNVNLGGVLWQKYATDIADDVKIGVRFPQISPFAESSYFEESYRKVVVPKVGSAGYLLVGWDFRITLRLDLDYADYPFDKRHLDIHIAPVSRTDNLMLVPDLSSYSATNRSQKSGVSPHIELPGNEILETYFNFSFDDYRTDFGFNNAGSYQGVPALHFNIHKKRLLLNAFITYLIPIFVTLCLAYILILACGKSEARQGIIESMAAFFFVLILSHIGLRRDVVTDDLMFMEYFYFITYLAIIITTLNLITYSKGQTSWFNYNNNQIFRVAYFPTYLTVILILLLVKFY